MPCFSKSVLVFQVQIFCTVASEIVKLNKIYLNIAALKKTWLDLVADN